MVEQVNLEQAEISDGLKTEWELAKEGIDLLLNNRIDEAEKLLRTDSNNIQLAAGYSFLTFINALMSYEEDKLGIALNALRDTERKCTNDVGWLKLVKNRMFGVDSKQQSLAETLEGQIVLADVQVCLAILTFLQQEFSGYIKGGWVLRKAWKIYQHVYNQILNLYIKEFGSINSDGSNPPHIPKNFQSTCSPPSTSQTNSSSVNDNVAESSSLWSVKSIDNFSPIDQSLIADELKLLANEKENLFDNVPTTDTNTKLLNGYNTNNYSYSNNEKITRSASGTSIRLSKLTQSISYPFGFVSNMIQSTSSSLLSSDLDITKKVITANEVARLMAAVSFGYGVFQLSASLLPPKMLKLTQLFGFGADRKAGIESLMYARRSTDMRAPLATLALLWYHTIVRPFFALDGCNLQAGAGIASDLITEAQTIYSQSALFLFFEGRIRRLESNISRALECYQLAVENSNQREIKLLCLHEVGWCYLIKLDYTEANATFTLLKQRSRWSRSFYAYLALLCAGACAILTEIQDVVQLKQILLNSVQKNAQLDLYLNRRVKLFPDCEAKLQQCTDLYWKLYIYELLYLWNALPSCNFDGITNIIKDCQQSENVEPMVGLAQLIIGSCFSILNDSASAVIAFRNCLQQRSENETACQASCSHIGAFAQYELGNILIKNTETFTEGKTLLQKTQADYKDYDFEHRLNVRIHSVLKHSCSSK